ncbi:hypothetical protein [Streptomyces anthocyanicus]|uniref:hypothetical protein n=1 Tax=Streptomyces anthocyanicus TaxID=68174 RepID=UPI003866D159|nr:hypothetical protein OH747_05340 [Streptomyces anthocyanicus]
MSETLIDLARTYEKEAHRFRTSQQTRWALQGTADLFRRMVGNQAAADPARLTLTMSMLLDIPDRWCRQHGYRAAAGVGGWVVQRDGEPAILARVGETLLWDGEQITVAP